jgi:hypothetical protein
MTDYDYIFSPDPDNLNRIRWNWIEQCLLGDIRTFLDGIAMCYCNEPVKQALTECDGISRGGGNLSVPVLIGTAVDLLSDLYSDETDETLRARCFIRDFFPGGSQHIAWLLWDGMRNAMTHCYLPREYDTGGGKCIRFVFTNAPSDAERCLVVQEATTGDAVIVVNVFGLYRALRSAVMDYRGQLGDSPELQAQFRKAWGPIEQRQKLKGPQNQTRENELGLMDMQGEASYLQAQLAKHSVIPLFG